MHAINNIGKSRKGKKQRGSTGVVGLPEQRVDPLLHSQIGKEIRRCYDVPRSRGPLSRCKEGSGIYLTVQVTAVGSAEYKLPKYFIKYY